MLVDTNNAPTSTRSEFFISVNADAGWSSNYNFKEKMDLLKNILNRKANPINYTQLKGIIFQPVIDDDIFSALGDYTKSLCKSAIYLLFKTDISTFNF